MTAPETRDAGLDALRHVAAFAGLTLTDQRLAELQPAVETAQRNFARLLSPELRDIEPAVAAPPLEEL